jgi:hypothetical protein
VTYAFRRGSIPRCIYSVPHGSYTWGFTDKLYWRRARGEWHCFKKVAQYAVISLYLASPTPKNHLYPWAANRPAPRLTCAATCVNGPVDGAYRRSYAIQ